MVTEVSHITNRWLQMASDGLNSLKAKKKILFVSCNGLKKNRVGRLVKSFFFCMILLVKNVCFMHVLR